MADRAQIVADDEQSAHLFVDRIAGAADRARRVASSQVRRLAIAGQALEIETIGDVGGWLEPLALPRLPPADDSELSVVVWDTRSTGVEAPSPGWRATDHLARGRITRLSSGAVQCSYNIESKVLTVVDCAAGRAYVCVRDRQHLPVYELAAPLRDALSALLASFGLPLLHAAAVTLNGRAALLAGRGGSGKSTTAASALGQGLAHLADDYCVAALDSEMATVFALYRGTKLLPAEAEHIATIGDRPGLADQASGKRYWLLPPGPSSASVAAILLPTVGTRTELSRVGGAQALRALAPSSLLQVPTSNTSSLSFMADLCRRAPCYRLALGPDRAANVRLIIDLLRESKP